MCAHKLILVIAVLTCPSWALRVPNLANRIMWGTEADIKDFPYVASLLYMGEHKCGASLIASNVAVTAAHCLEYKYVVYLSLRVGSSRWDSGGQEISVKEFFVHEYYMNVYNYDVAVMILSENVQVKNAVPISLAPADRRYPHGTLGVVVGWGETDTEYYSDTLLKVEVPIVEESKCQLFYDPGSITQRHICAGKGSCRGDSGGPYIINGELAGIVSYGNESCYFLFPDVYTSVPVFHNWIRERAGWPVLTGGMSFSR